ncbi:MAG: TM0106 family RecB-like putative nuclease, partial [Clostridia bacterium]
MFRLDDGRMILTATDLSVFPDCTHRTWLDQGAALGAWGRPSGHDVFLDLLSRRGTQHETAYLQTLKDSYAAVREFPTPTYSPDALAAAQAQTLAAMTEGVEVLYQPTLFDGTFYGRPDFLVRVAGQSRLGPYQYQVRDTKLARSARAEALVQTLSYARQVRDLGGSDRDAAIVLALGTGEQAAFRVEAGLSYVRRLEGRLLAEVTQWPRSSTSAPVPACELCPWHERCMTEWETADHLSLVAGIRGDQIRKLQEAGVHTAGDLALLDPGTRIPGMAPDILARLVDQAGLQVSAANSGEGESLKYRILPPQVGRGFATLPAPSPLDLFWDLEGDPLDPDGSLEYLWGVGAWNGTEFIFKPTWAHDHAGERAAFEHFVDSVLDRWKRDPAMHVYHYGAYEPSVLKRLMGRYGTREQEVDRLLRAGVLVDLYAVVRQALRLSRPSYSLKEVEKFYGVRHGDIQKAGQSVVRYAEWRDTGNPQALAD